MKMHLRSTSRRTLNRMSNQLPQIRRNCARVPRDNKLHETLPLACNPKVRKRKELSHSTLVLISNHRSNLHRAWTSIKKLLKPLKDLLALLEEVIMWQRPAAPLSAISAALIITYK
ncbi:hypothetical protein FEM48_Zijuj12G0137400 [Ziziphus jujuba var. spinosa]|uniref:Uncharacterized protein n=1 Tax=Ziziphus jujuba var. spinosa TaxID=714518 RepID=A0A978UDP0_ZIZJJ|nr:hypothetical protein FEM48_Zijuj12G0137400 [Ziziphus jujuba var. spinosa]